MVVHTTNTDTPVDIRLVQIDLTNALTQLASAAAVEIQFDPSIVNQKAADGRPKVQPQVSANWKQVSALQAMQALLDNYNLQATTIPDSPALRIVARNPSAPGPLVTTVNLTNKSSPDGPTATNAVHTDAGDAPISLSIGNIGLPDAMKELARMADLNIQFDPALLNQMGPDRKRVPPPQVAEKLENVTLRQALQELLDKNGWRITRIDGDPILRITTNKP
jgi:hypothetical protein